MKTPYVYLPAAERLEIETRFCRDMSETQHSMNSVKREYRANYNMSMTHWDRIWTMYRREGPQVLKTHTLGADMRERLDAPVVERPWCAPDDDNAGKRVVRDITIRLRTFLGEPIDHLLETV